MSHQRSPKYGLGRGDTVALKTWSQLFCFELIFAAKMSARRARRRSRNCPLPSRTSVHGLVCHVPCGWKLSTGILQASSERILFAKHCESYESTRRTRCRSGLKANDRAGRVIRLSTFNVSLTFYIGSYHTIGKHFYDMHSPIVYNSTST